MCGALFFLREKYLQKCILWEKTACFFPGGCSNCYMWLVQNWSYWRNVYANSSWILWGHFSEASKYCMVGSRNWCCVCVCFFSFFFSVCGCYVLKSLPADTSTCRNWLSPEWKTLLVCRAWWMRKLTVISGKFIGCTVTRWRAMELCERCRVPCSVVWPSPWTGGAGEGAGTVCHHFFRQWASIALHSFPAKLLWEMHEQIHKA